METIVRVSLAIAVVFVHLPFLAAWLRYLRQSLMPHPILFACVGVFLYYDLGLLLQSWSWSYDSRFFLHLDAYSMESYTLLCMVIGVTPYLLYLGCRMVGPVNALPSTVHLGTFIPKLEVLFLWLFFPLCLLLSIEAFGFVWGVSNLVDMKRRWLDELGRSYIIFVAPLFLLAFYVRTKSADGIGGMLRCTFLASCASVATLFLGQRTLTFLPFLILVLFRFRVTLPRVIGLPLVLLVLSAMALWFYKGEVQGADGDVATQITTVVNNDLIRTNVLARALADSPPVGSYIMPEPGRGYLAAALLYCPRSILPSKGYSTAAYFTATANGDDLEFISWGLGIGFLEELTLNWGTFVLPPGILLYGVLVGFLGRLSKRWRTAMVGSHLAPLWMCGYGSASVFLYFGSMIIVSILLEEVFIRSSSTQIKLAENAERIRYVVNSQDIDARASL